MEIWWRKSKSYDVTVIQDGVLFAVNLDRPDDVGSLRIFVRENEHEYQEQYYKQGVAYLTIYNNIMTFIYYANGYVVTTEDVIAPEVYIHLYDTEGKLITVVQRASSLNTRLEIIEATAGTYNKGDSVLIIDGFGKATYNGESCEYYSTPFNRVVVKTKAGSVGLALNVDEMTFELAEQDGHQGEYRNDGSIVITIDGWGGMFTDPQDEMLSPSFYTYVLDGRDLTATIDGINHYYTFRSYGNGLVRKQDGTVWQKTGTHYEIEVDINV